MCSSGGTERLRLQPQGRARQGSGWQPHTHVDDWSGGKHMLEMFPLQGNPTNSAFFFSAQVVQTRRAAGIGRGSQHFQGWRFCSGSTQAARKGRRSRGQCLSQFVSMPAAGCLLPLTKGCKAAGSSLCIMGRHGEGVKQATTFLVSGPSHTCRRLC